MAVTGSKSVINYGMNATIKYEGRELEEYFNIINIDYYDAILGTPFLRKHEVIINFVNNCLRIRDKSFAIKQMNIKWGRRTHRKPKRMFQ